jgi:hypothetical protein
MQIGDKIPGGRLSHYYAVIEAIHSDHILIRYNGECRSVRINAADYHRVGAKAND